MSKKLNDILNIIGLSKSFGCAKVINDLSISLEKGKVYTIIGGNGCGKTTLINLIAGFFHPDTGIILYNQKPIIGLSPYKINRLGICRTFQDLRLIQELSVGDNILFSMENKIFSIETEDQRRYTHEVAEKLSLSELYDTKVKDISYGQQKLLTIGCCIANGGELLLIDEPVAGIDKFNRQKIIQLVNMLKANGKTILQIEHDRSYIDMSSDVILKMEGGKIC